MRSSETNWTAACPSVMPAEARARAHNSSTSCAVGPSASPSDPPGATPSIPITSTSSILTALPSRPVPRSPGLRSLAGPQPRGQLLGVLVVRRHDAAHQLVADHVLLAKAHELDAL